MLETQGIPIMFTICSCFSQQKPQHTLMNSPTTIEEVHTLLGGLRKEDFADEATFEVVNSILNGPAIRRLRGISPFAPISLELERAIDDLVGIALSGRETAFDKDLRDKYVARIKDYLLTLSEEGQIRLEDFTLTVRYGDRGDTRRIGALSKQAGVVFDLIAWDNGSNPELIGFWIMARQKALQLYEQIGELLKDLWSWVCSSIKGGLTMLAAWLVQAVLRLHQALLVSKYGRIALRSIASWLINLMKKYVPPGPLAAMLPKSLPDVDDADFAPKFRVILSTLINIVGLIIDIQWDKFRERFNALIESMGDTWDKFTTLLGDVLQNVIDTVTTWYSSPNYKM